MTRLRSPSYPNFSLSEALDRVEKVFEADRQNPVDRETIAMHIGYSGISGASDKAISTLSQFGLLEKVAKGELRVTDLAVDILHPETAAAKAVALREAFKSPPLFDQLADRFAESPSLHALQSYLKREGFLERAISPTSSSYLESCQLLERFPLKKSGDAPNAADETISEPLEEASQPAVLSLRSAPPPPHFPQNSHQDETVDIFNISGGGRVSILLPKTLSAGDYADLKDWLDLMARRAERRVRDDRFDEIADIL